MNFKWVRYFFCALILYLMIQVPWKSYHQEKGGWDHQIYCKAVEAVKAGQDPYLTANLGLDLSYPYPAIFLKLYKPFCGTDAKGYILVHFVALLSVAFIESKKNKAPFS